MVDDDRFITGLTRCILNDTYATPLARPVIGNYFAIGMHWPAVPTEDEVICAQLHAGLEGFHQAAARAYGWGKRGIRNPERLAEGIGQIPKVRAVPGWGAIILAGAGAGVVAALASVGAEIILYAQRPPGL